MARKHSMVAILPALIAGGLSLTLSQGLVVAANPHGEKLTEIPEPVAVEQLEDPRDILKRYRPLKTVPRIPVLEDGDYYPCTDCHDGESQETNPIVRTLEDEHDELTLAHGGGRYWCLTCHSSDNRDQLQSLKGQPISFDEPHLLCGQCHFQRQRDFFMGAHGKRIGSWNGERVVETCTACHNPHAPQILPAKPFPAPKARKGLEIDKRPRHHPPTWAEKAAQRNGAKKEAH